MYKRQRLTYASFQQLFGSWTIYRAGWSPSGGKDIPAIVHEISALLGTPGHADPHVWTGRRANDAGLDLLCFRGFPDARDCVPMIAVQCASGANWISKLTEPVPNVWGKILDASFNPTRALAIPFVIDKEELRRRCATIEGPLFDRNRILSASTHDANWVDQALQNDINNWLEPRVANLPFIQ